MEFLAGARPGRGMLNALIQLVGRQNRDRGMKGFPDALEYLKDEGGTGRPGAPKNERSGSSKVFILNPVRYRI